MIQEALAAFDRTQSLSSADRDTVKTGFLTRLTRMTGLTEAPSSRDVSDALFGGAAVGRELDAPVVSDDRHLTHPETKQVVDVEEYRPCPGPSGGSRSRLSSSRETKEVARYPLGDTGEGGRDITGQVELLDAVVSLAADVDHPEGVGVLPAVASINDEVQPADRLPVVVSQHE